LEALARRAAGCHPRRRAAVPTPEYTNRR
jgi:hypothetical protein